MRRIITLVTAVFFVNHVIKAQCDPAFTVSVNQSLASFAGSNNLPGKFHYWDFGDGQYGTGRYAYHYYAAGTYQVRHVVADSLGACMDSLIQTVTISYVSTCQASFVAVYDSLDFGSGIFFYSNSTASGPGIQTFNWTVNGVSQPGNNSFFQLARTPGVKNVCLTITTYTGCTSTYCRSFTIPPFCNLNPSFTYTADPYNSRMITFHPVPNQPNLKYRWQFGDGVSSWQTIPAHTYPSAGTYNVKLTIRDTVSNCVDTLRQNITVVNIPPCTAGFTDSLNNTGMGFFTAYSNQPIVSQSWLIYRFATGDSIWINAMNPSYQFPDTGYYYVCLTLMTNTGCIASSCRWIYVNNVAGRYEERILSYPNPARTGTVNMNMIMGAAGPLDIKVYDMTGTIVYQSQQQGQAGGNIIRIPVDQLNRGQYFVEICYRYKIKRSIFQKL